MNCCPLVRDPLPPAPRSGHFPVAPNETRLGVGQWLAPMRFDQFIDHIGAVLRFLGAIALFVVFPIWVSTIPCSEFRQRSQHAFCSPPERSIGRAAVYAVSDWWDGVVIWK